MIHCFHVKNYRGFKDFKTGPLERVNLITGSNNVGKTALLEALYLNLSPKMAIVSNQNSEKPESSTRHYLFRGFKDVQFSLDIVSRWGWLFHGKILSKDIELTSNLDNGKTQELVMRWNISGHGGGVPITDDIALDDPAILYLDVRVRSIEGNEYSWLIRKGGDHPPETYVRDPIPLRLLFNVSSRSPEEDTKWFSRLADVGRQDEIVKTLRLIEPRLKGLAVSTSDGPALIYGDIGVGRRVPMSQMGEGMARLLSLVLEIENAAGGVVLVDEIENGLHYSVMGRVWEALAAAARQSDTQIFATTHSFECIRAAHEAFLARDKYDFRLHRLERTDSGIRVVTYDSKMLSAAMASDFEVR